MCLTCGCLEPFNDHGDRRNITYKDLSDAATASDLTVAQATRNLVATVAVAPDASVGLASVLRRPTILTDIDGVLGFLTEEIVAALNAHFGLNLVVSQMDNYWIEDQLSPPQSAWLVAQFNRPVFYENVAPDYAAIAALGAIHQGGYEVIVSSDRPTNTQAATERWLTKWRVSYDELILRGRGGKLSVAREHGPADPLILIDDDPRKMVTIPAPGVELWSPQRPWTPVNWQDYQGVWVFESWADVLRRLGLATMVPIPQFSRDAGPAYEAPNPNHPLTTV